MMLSSEREAELVEQNMPKIYRAIDNFMSRCNQQQGVQISYDDCVQEVAMAFLQYIRRCDSEEKLAVFPWYDAMHAMSEHILRSQPLRVPITTKKFNSIIHSIPATVSYDVLLSRGMEVDGMSKYWVPDVETEIDFNTFMSEQSELTQRIASMCLYGMSYRDIAAQCGVSKSLVCKRINELREKYDIFDKGDTNDE